MTSLPSGVVTFLLTDVEGSTRLWEQSPQAMAEALEAHDRLIDSAVAASGGVVLKARGEGDATFSVFARASDAAAAASAIQSGLACEPWPHDVVLRVRMAIHMGEAIERGGDYFGPAVNRVARLRAIASGGEVLLSRSAAETLLDHAQGAWMLEELGERQLKDLARPESVWRLGTVAPAAAITVAEDGPAALPLPPMLGVTVDLVGRDDELARLRKLWGEAQAGGVRLALLGGEPGVGKTTLARAIAQEAHDAGGIVLSGRNDEHLRGEYQSVIEAVSMLMKSMSAVQLASFGRHTAELTRLFPELTTRVPGLPAPTATDPEAERWLVNNALVAVLASADAPVVLVLDDLQWASPTTIQFVDHLVRHPDNLRLLVVGTYRDTETADPAFSDLTADLHREQAGFMVTLQGLTPDAVRTLVAATAGHALDDQAQLLADAVHRETGGNPFFVREVLLDLAESGAIFQENDRWQSSTDASQIALPAGVKVVLERRLARLDDDCRRALTVAAVAGSTFRLDLVEAVSDEGHAERVLDALERAAAAGLIAEQGSEFAFAHALIRQTVLAGLGIARRCRLHRRIGEALEARPNVDLNATAYHFAEAAAEGDASLVTKAVDHILAAAEQTLDIGAFQQTLALAESGLALLERLPQPDPARRCDLLTLSVDAKTIIGEFDAARRSAVMAWADATALADPTRMAEAAAAGMRIQVGTPDDEAAARVHAALRALGDDDPRRKTELLLILVGFTSETQGDRAGAIRLFEEATLLTDRCGGDPQVARWLYRTEAALYETAADHARMLEIAAELEALPGLRNRRDRVFNLYSPSLIRQRVAWEQGDLATVDMAQAIGEAEAERTHSWADWYDAATMRIMRPLSRGDWAAAQVELDALLANVREANSTNGWAANSMLMARDRDAWGEVLPLLEDAVESQPGLAGFRGGRCLARIELGDREGAAADLAYFAAGEFRDLPHDQTFAVSLSQFAEAAARLGDAAVAVTLYELLLPFADIILSVGSTVSVGAADRYLGMLAGLLGRPEADAHFEKALELETRLGATAYLVRTRTWYGRVVAARGEHDRAAALWSEAYAEATQLGMAGVVAEIDELRALHLS